MKELPCKYGSSYDYTSMHVFIAATCDATKHSLILKGKSLPSTLFQQKSNEKKCKTTRLRLSFLRFKGCKQLLHHSKEDMGGGEV